MTACCILLSAVACVLWTALALRIGYAAGWRDGRDDGTRRVEQCKMHWCGKVDDKETERREDLARLQGYVRYLENSLAEFATIHHYHVAARDNCGCGKN